MTAPVQDPAHTAGILFCRQRRLGCYWSEEYKTFADEPEALRLRARHEESECRYRPRHRIGGFQ